MNLSEILLFISLYVKHSTSVSHDHASQVGYLHINFNCLYKPFLAYFSVMCYLSVQWFLIQLYFL